MADAIRILYVDDEPSLLEIGKIFLEQSGEFKVTTALSAPEAIRLLEQERFDAIISDYQMPGMDGIQFLVEVRVRFGQIPFILFTGRGRETVVIQAINSGADFYLQKGGEPSAQFAELIYHINRAISRKKAGEEIIFKNLLLTTQQETSLDGILVVDELGKIISLNQHFVDLWGIPKDVIASGSDELTLASVLGKLKDPDAFLSRVNYLYSNKAEKSHEEIFLKDGRVFDRYSAPMFGEKDRYFGRVWYFRDITGQKLAKDTLHKVNRKLHVLSQLTRQDLTTQIFILDSYLEMAKKQAAGQDCIIKNIESGELAVRSIKKITVFTKDYQDMGEKPPKWQNVRLAFLFGLSHISIGKIRHSLETENLEIFADNLLEKAFQGLLENSTEHGGHVSLIRLWHTATPDRVTIVFEDDGTGIPQEKKEQIFLRGEGVRASVRGLFFVREILDITGITIKETGEPGKGARFEMTVPKGMWRITGKGA